MQFIIFLITMFYINYATYGTRLQKKLILMRFKTLSSSLSYFPASFSFSRKDTIFL